VLSQKSLGMAVVTCLLSVGACARSHGSPIKGSPSVPDASAGHSDSGAPKNDGIGTKAVAKLEPVVDASTAEPADASAAAAHPIMGTATFAQREAGVNLAISFLGCDMNESYEVFIQQGTDCSQATLLGARWDDSRGTDISDAMCIGTGGTGRAYYKRASTDPKPWTIGGPLSSDILGHAVVLYASDMPMRPIACGTIALDALAPAIDPGAADARVPPVEVRAELGGYCLTQIIARNNSQPCPDLEQYESCAKANCDLTTCFSLCTEYSACLEAAPTTDLLGNGIAGAACTGDRECKGGRCAATSALGTPFPGNYCTGSCASDTDCGRGGACLVLAGSASAGQCFAACTADAECRQDYRCRELNDGFTACYPALLPLPDGAAGKACKSDTECGSAGTCATVLPFGDFAAYVNTAAPNGYCTEPCSLHSDCGAGGLCISHGMKGGTCLSSCTSASDCRTGYWCAALTYRTDMLQVCVPTVPDAGL
jgi:hypothetical protein